MADLAQSLVEHDLTPGKLIHISPLVRRLTANNASIYTGPGTNTYIVGHDKIAVIDPGPIDDEAHIDAIMQATGGKIDWLLATHTHIDHSPAIKVLAEKTGATLIGRKLSVNDEYLDGYFSPRLDINDGEQVTSDEFSITAITTPGHVDNHVCYLLDQEMMLFSGDHIMQGATVVIVPQHGGCMTDYMASVAKLKQQGIEYIAPAHGHIMADADSVFTDLYDHRKYQEQKTLTALQNVKRASLKELAKIVYPTVDIDLNEGAQIILWSHLEKLASEGFAVRESSTKIDGRKFTEDIWLAL